MAIEKVIKIKVDSKDAVKGIKEVDKSIEEVNESTDDLTGSIGGMGGAAISSFKSMSKGVSVAVKSLTTLKGAVIATGIGALLILIVSLKAAFTSTEEGQNKFSKLMGVIGSVVGNVVDVLAEFGTFVIDLFSGESGAIKSLTSFGKKIFDVVGLPIKT